MPLFVLWLFQIVFIAHSNSVVILSERSESKDLRTNFTANVIKMRRSLDSTSFRSG